ncbi:transcriptional regulator with XRE-family HTH domain [Pedobacter sp. CAN_A7]|uniref:helix-turn-helix domain-containing protein n=1 Tax=Pedobacter sp. CAN_A7 TaxID=2787722 RepID=UPI0018CAD0FB
MKNLGKYIKELRLKCGWTQVIVADQLEISIPAFSKIESGITIINIVRLKQIADIFNVPVSTLLNAEFHENQYTNDNRIKELQKSISEKDENILQLQKKIIGLYEKEEQVVN